MNLLFLRGQVPQDRNPKQIMFDCLEDCDDMWTQLAAAISEDDYGEIWYWNGSRKIRYRDNFIERWVPNYTKHKIRFEPDVIFARGGFPQYDSMLKKFPNAFKIYYGAGRRFAPQSRFRDYDLVLVDSPKQQSIVRKKMPQSRVELMVKPAADNIFRPVIARKRYDAIFCANESSRKASIKGHEFVLKTFPSNMRLVQSGIVKKSTRQNHPNIDFTGWIPRKNLLDLYGAAKFAIVWCEGGVDSCPRVIPEALACGCPLLIRSKTTFWHDKYITDKTGIFANDSDFVEKCRWMVDNYTSFTPHAYYEENLSIRRASDHIRSMIS